MSIETV